MNHYYSINKWVFSKWPCYVSKVSNNGPMSLYWPEATAMAIAHFAGHYYKPRTHNRAIMKTPFFNTFINQLKPLFMYASTIVRKSYFQNLSPVKYSPDLVINLVNSIIFYFVLIVVVNIKICIFLATSLK